MSKMSHKIIDRLNSERGVVGFIVAAVALPILVVLCVGLFDLVREPLARNAIQSVTKLFAKEIGQGIKAADADAMVDGHVPAGNNIFELFSVAPTPSGASSSTIERSGILNATNALGLINLACSIASVKMEEALTSYVVNKNGDHNYSFQIGIVKLTFGDSPAATTVAASADDKICAGMKFDDTGQADLISEVSANLLQELQTDGVGEGRGAWYVDDGAAFASTNVLPSYWLVVAGYVKIEPYFSSVFGATKEVTSVSVLDLGIPAGFESTSAYIPPES